MLAGAALLTVAAPGLAPQALAQQSHMSISPAELSSSRDVALGLGKSLVIDLPRDAKDVLVANPTVADAVMRTARRAYLIGMTVGQTNVFFFDEAGRQIAVLEVNVARDTHAIGQTIRQLIPGSQVKVEAAADNIVLTGSVRTPADAKTAADIAARYIGEPEKVLNMISSAGSEQVHLKVTIAEVKRSVLKQLGVNLSFLGANNRLSGQISNPFSVNGPISDTSVVATLGNATCRALAGGDYAPGEIIPVVPDLISNACSNLGGAVDGDLVSAQIRAMEQQGLMRVLAEPTLSAISGETADFLAGGEFPVITGVDRDTGAPTLEFKQFGVALGFTPVVQSGGRISMKVRTEASELSNEGAVTIANGYAIPGLQVRRAETTVELPSGGSLVLAGLIQQESRQAFNGVPGLKDVPILGALFRSRDYINNETELVVFATPYLVKPVAAKELTRPDKNLAPASDPAAILLGRFNRLYGVGGATPTGGYQGQVGFIVE
ncbi:type II and III secretion system protein family protein [Lutibaculum baratangense]|nr:type II and III secretion system protein family protein [Lutibaculum baratangense]